MALRCRSLYDRLRAIAQYDYTRRPDALLILTPIVWEESLTTRFCINLNLDDYFVAVETRPWTGRSGREMSRLLWKAAGSTCGCTGPST